MKNEQTNKQTNKSRPRLDYGQTDKTQITIEIITAKMIITEYLCDSLLAIALRGRGVRLTRVVKKSMSGNRSSMSG